MLGFWICRCAERVSRKSSRRLSVLIAKGCSFDMCCPSSQQQVFTLLFNIPNANVFIPSLQHPKGSTYPEVHIQVSASSKFPVADLEGDGHPVIGVQHFVEALARVSPQLHVVRKAEHNAGQQHQQGVERGRHGCGVATDRWLGVVVVRLDATVVRSLGVVGGLCRTCACTASGGEPASGKLGLGFTYGYRFCICLLLHQLAIIDPGDMV